VPALFRHSVFWIVVYLAIFSAFGILLAMGRIPAEGVAIQDTVARVVAMLVAAALTVHFLSDELLLNRLRRVAFGARHQQNVAGFLQRSGTAVVWLGMFVLAGWLMATGRNTENLNIDVYDNVVTAYPNSWRAHTGLALELANIGELPTAVEELKLATELNPDAANLRIELGRMLLAVNQPQEAAEELQRAIALNPTATAAYTELGNAMLAQGKVKEGLAYLRTAAERRPDDPVARMKLGLAYFSLRQWEDALSSFSEAIELDPEFAMAYNGRGNVYWNEGKPDAAMKEFGEAIRIDPELVSAYRNRARVWLDTKDEQKAMDDLDTAIRLDGSNAADYVLRGDLHYSRGDFAKALQDFQKAAELDRQSMVPLERLVTLWSSCPDESHRNLELASQAARSMCQLTEWRMPAALQTLAVVLAAQGNYDEGLRWQTEAVKLAAEGAKESYQKQLETLKQLSEKADADKSGSGSGS
jgi:tetratricopeptide (TPR) repeat protein